MAKAKKDVIEEPMVEGKVESKKVSKSTIKKDLKKIAKDVDVEIMNITNGKLIYRCPKTSETIELESPGDVTIVSLEYLINMRNKGLLENLLLSIVDIYEDEYTVEDVVSLLGLDRLYKDCNMTLQGLDELIEGSKNDNFESLVNKMDGKALERIVERSVMLSKDNGFDSNYKRSILEEKTNNRYLFKSI